MSMNEVKDMFCFVFLAMDHGGCLPRAEFRSNRSLVTQKE